MVGLTTKMMFLIKFLVLALLADAAFAVLKCPYKYEYVEEVPNADLCIPGIFAAEPLGDYATQMGISRARSKLEEGKIKEVEEIYKDLVLYNPHQVEILNEYGEFLENHMSDVITAENMYCRALLQNPTHKRSIANFNRTSPVVKSLDQRKYKEIYERSRALAASQQGQGQGKGKWKLLHYFDQMYPIEGAFLPYGKMGAYLETRRTVEFLDTIDNILGIKAAVTYADNMKSIKNISLDDILEMHEKLFVNEKLDTAGKYRDEEIHVNNFFAPGAIYVPWRMSKYMDWLTSNASAYLHPIEFAALAHWNFTSILPFFDKNGRVARLLMNYILVENGYPPVMIRLPDKLPYYKVMMESWNGDVRPFIRYMSGYIEKALDEYLKDVVIN